MYDRVLFPTDGSEGADEVLEHVLDVAAAYDATVHVLHVADTTRDSVLQIRGEVVDALEREGEQIVRRAAERADERRVETVTEVLQGEPYSTIVEYASSRDVDIVVMPTHGRRGLERFLLGSTTERVVRRSDVPVLTVRPADPARIDYPYREILVPTDGSDAAREALSVGVDVTRAEGASLHLVSVVVLTGLGVDVRTDVQTTALEEGASRVLDDAAEFAADSGVEPASKTVEYGSSIHEAILSYIDEEDVSLVVVGTHGRTGFDRYLLGSVTEYLIRTSPIPVLTVRTRENGS